MLVAQGAAFWFGLILLGVVLCLMMVAAVADE